MLETYQANIIQQDTEEDEKLIETFGFQQERNYDSVVASTWEKAALPKFCWI